MYIHSLSRKITCSVPKVKMITILNKMVYDIMIINYEAYGLNMWCNGLSRAEWASISKMLI